MSKKYLSLDSFVKNKVIDKIIENLNTGQYAAIQKYFSKEMLQQFPLSKAKPVFDRILNQNGKILRAGLPRFVGANQIIFPLNFQHGILDFKLFIDVKGNIYGLWFIPHTPDIPVPEKLETKLSLPFMGNWLVHWGGDTKELNYHHDIRSQRFAIDFFAVDDNGKINKGNGLKNEDYFSFGKKILAPADGSITDVINGVRDNKPWSVNPHYELGNAVFIKHRDYEVSVLVHLRLDSIKVKVGEDVTKGQVIGLCGNSGHSDRPHLHYQVQNTDIVQDGTGLKPYFEKLFLIKGNKKEEKLNYSPIKDEIVSAD